MVEELVRHFRFDGYINLIGFGGLLPVQIAARELLPVVKASPAVRAPARASIIVWSGTTMMKQNPSRELEEGLEQALPHAPHLIRAVPPFVAGEPQMDHERAGPSLGALEGLPHGFRHLLHEAYDRGYDRRVTESP